MSEPIELPHIDRIDYVGGSYPMAIKPDGEYVDYDDHVAIVRQLAEQRAELLEALRWAEAALADIGDADREDGDDLSWCERRAAKDLSAIRTAIANATQQRKEPGA